jgi:hypothetical protein
MAFVPIYEAAKRTADTVCLFWENRELLLAAAKALGKLAAKLFKGVGEGLKNFGKRFGKNIANAKKLINSLKVGKKFANVMAKVGKWASPAARKAVAEKAKKMAAAAKKAAAAAAKKVADKAKKAAANAKKAAKKTVKKIGKWFRRRRLLAQTEES